MKRHTWRDYGYRGCSTFAAFGFVASWNNLILPLVMLSDQSLWPATRGLYGSFSQCTSQRPLVAAATVIIVATVIVVFVLLQRHLVEGVAGGAVAGTQPVTRTGPSTATYTETPTAGQRVARRAKKERSYERGQATPDYRNVHQESGAI